MSGELTTSGTLSLPPERPRAALSFESASALAAWASTSCVLIAVSCSALTSALSRARVEEADAVARENEAQRQVASRRADAQVVVSGRARWHETQHKRAEAKEEEASSEAWRPVKS